MRRARILSHMIRGLICLIVLVLSVHPASTAPPSIPGNSGVPGLLAQIAALQTQIAALQAELATLERQARVAQTGQTTSYAAGDDGAIQAGVPFPTPRFTDNSNGTVTDNLTGLIWLKNADCFGSQTWANALNAANALAHGSCSLTDGSVAGDWHIPNIKELQSLIDFGQLFPALPPGHLFLNVQSDDYWSSTSDALSPTLAWIVYLPAGGAVAVGKENFHSVWPVRGGQ